MTKNQKYVLTPNNFYEVETEKTQIVIGSTFSSKMNHFKGWKTRLNGKYKKTTHYTIDINGRVYEHFDPKYYSTFIGVDNIDRNIISIVLENQGWLKKDLKTDGFIDMVGNIYNGKVFEKKWRNFNYWASYNNKQFVSLIGLIKDISDRFKIPLNIVSHNTKIDIGINNFSGILYRSNFANLATDPNPSLDFDKLKEGVEFLKIIENE